MSHEYKFYIQKVQKNSDGSYSLVDGTLKDLEKDFKGLKYSKLEGINTKGKAKNITVETYANASYDRVHIPADGIKRTSTTLTLTLYFFGDSTTRQASLKEFADYISNGVHRYWDTARNAWFDFIVKDEMKPSNELWYAGKPYFKVDVKMDNIYGECYLRKGVNILLDSDRTYETTNFLLARIQIDQNRIPIDGDKCKITFGGYMGIGRDTFRVYNSDGSVYMSTITYNNNYNVDTKTYSSIFDWINGPNTHINIYQYPDDDTLMTSKIENVKLEIL